MKLIINFNGITFACHAILPIPRLHPPSSALYPIPTLQVMLMCFLDTSEPFANLPRPIDERLMT